MAKTRSPAKTKRQPVSFKQPRKSTKRASQTGDESLAAVQKTLDENPAVWQTIGNGLWRAEEAWIGLIAGGDLCVAESIRRSQQDLRKQLLRATALSRLERVHVYRIALDMLQESYFETELAKATMMGDIQAAKHLSLQLHRAHSRVMVSTKGLGIVHRIIQNSPMAYSVGREPEGMYDQAEWDADTPRGPGPVYCAPNPPEIMYDVRQDVSQDNQNADVTVDDSHKEADEFSDDELDLDDDDEDEFDDDMWIDEDEIELD